MSTTPAKPPPAAAGDAAASTVGTIAAVAAPGSNKAGNVAGSPLGGEVAENNSGSCEQGAGGRAGGGGKGARGGEGARDAMHSAPGTKINRKGEIGG